MKSKEKWIHGIAVIIITTIFVILRLIEGVIIYPDTAGYIAMDTMREPLYPLFLQFIKVLIGTNYYLEVVVWIQLVLTIIAIAHFTLKISDEYEIHGLAIVSIYVILVIFYVLPTFVLATNATSFLAIWTEGITYPLFMLYAEHLVIAGSNLSIKQCNVALIYACLLSLTRSGLLPTILVILVVRIYIAYRSGCFGKGCVRAILITIAAFLALTAIEKIYFMVVHGRFMSHTYGAITTMSNVVFVSDKEDVELIEDPKSQKVYEEMYDIAKQEGWLYDTESEKGLIARALDVENAHDPIKFYAYSDAVKDVVPNVTDPIEDAIEKDQIATNITRALFIDNMALWLEDYIGLCLSGFIRTIAVLPASRLMQVYTLVLYALAGVGIYVFRKNRRIAIYLGIVFLSIVANVCAVSLVIMPTSRYMVYNLPLFYTGFVIMWCNRTKRVE